MKRWRSRPGLWLIFSFFLASLARAAPGASRADCVSGGAPFIQPPALDDRDRFVFATADGSIHGFEPDGRYRFTATLKALPVGMLMRPDGRFYIATADRRLHAFTAEGLEVWSLALFDLPRGAPFAVTPAQVGVLGTRGELAVFSDRGTRLYTLRAPRAGGAPVASGSFLWLATESGDLRAFEGAWRARDVVFDGTPALIGAAPGGSVLVQSGTDLLRVDVRGLERIESGVRFATQRAGYTGLVLGREASNSAELLLLDAKGRDLARAPMVAPTRIAPAVGRGEVFAALQDGRIQVLGPDRRGVLAGFREPPQGLVAGRRILLGLFGGDRICILS